MKKLLLVLTAAAFAFSAQAQWRAGVSAGVSHNWYSIKTHYQTDFNYEGLSAPSVALVGQYDFKDWFGVRAELEYLRKDHKFFRTSVYDETHYKVRNTYLQLPVMAVFSFGGEKIKGFTHLGAYAGYWAKSTLKGSLLNPSDEEAIAVDESYSFNSEKDRRLDLGLLAGVGMEYRFSPKWAVEFEARLNYSLVSTTKQYMALGDYRYNTTASFRVGLQYIF